MSKGEAKKASRPVDEKVLDQITRARLQRQKRLKAPLAFLKQTRIPQKLQVARIAKDQGFKGNNDPEGNHYFHGDRNMSEIYVDQGYEPSVVDGKQESYQGDPVWQMPTKQWEKLQKAETDVRRQKMKDRIAKDKKEADDTPTSTGEDVRAKQFVDSFAD